MNATIIEMTLEGGSKMKGYTLGNKDTLIAAAEEHSNRKVQSWRTIGVIDSNQFTTAYDNLRAHVESGYGQKRYNEGVALGKEFTCIYIAQNKVWSAGNYSGKSLSAYEVIGFHACTRNLFEGFLDSKLPIIDFSL